MKEITNEFVDKILNKFRNTMTEDALNIQNSRREQRWKELEKMDFEKMTQEEYDEYCVIMSYTGKADIRKWADDLNETEEKAGSLPALNHIHP